MSKAKGKSKKRSALYLLQNRVVEGLEECPKCKNQVERLYVDHIFPASILAGWGLNSWISEDGENLELICRACNILKSNRFDFHNPKTIPLIEKYLNLLKKIYPTHYRYEKSITNQKTL